MEKAQKDLARSKNSPEAQQAAVDALKKAEKELGEKVAKLEQDEKQLAGLEKLLEKVETVIKDQQVVRLDTAKNSVKPDTKPVGEIAGQNDLVLLFRQILAHNAPDEGMSEPALDVAVQVLAP